jgi:5-methylcytosine-specific restriction endonuclease McrA
LCQSLGCSSLFKYCTQVLGLSEQAAYRRINAARAARRFPAVLPMLAEGALTLSSIGLLAPHLTDENRDVLLEAAQKKSTREVQKIVACANPQPDIPASVRALPTTSALTAARPVVAPLAPRRYLLKVTIGEETHAKLERARALLRHAIPDGDPAVLLDRALTLLIEDVERTKCAATSRPRASQPSAAAGARTRHIPAAVKRAVWRRDQGKCAFVGSLGRCEETAFLEFHHLEPFAAGGGSAVENLQLRCRAHNQHEARLYFGDEISQCDDELPGHDWNSARA